MILSIARAIGDIDRNRAVISILKNRSGKSGKIFNNVKFDNGTSTISCDEIQEFDDTLAWEETAKELESKNRIKLARSVYANKDNILSEVDDNEREEEGNFVGVIGGKIQPNLNF